MPSRGSLALFETSSAKAGDARASGCRAVTLMTFAGANVASRA